ncbi:UDP-glucose dehydrogenase [hydrothermal vent metagenome]|uniref:UDP-glucose dehydrogenase n=1 Tax=hydrothermal vent metagenome TaxID=652676 RepID=A0A1W1DZS8_9ZZZZ
MKIAVAGMGYVGLANAMLLAQNHEVVALDIVFEKVAQLNRKISPIEGVEIEDFLVNRKLNFKATVEVMEINPDAVMVIKSTVPVGYTQSVKDRFNCDNILFSPEFLREGRALSDNLYPSRIIVGGESDKVRVFAVLLDIGLCLWQNILMLNRHYWTVILIMTLL